MHDACPSGEEVTKVFCLVLIPLVLLNVFSSFILFFFLSLLLSFLKGKGRRRGGWVGRK